jgi:hypothetical protein
MDYRKDSRLQIILVCVILALLLAWYLLPMQHTTSLTPTAAPTPAEAPAKPATPDQPK